jgi:hypothetical protein
VLPAQAAPERMDGSDDLPDMSMRSLTRHQVTGSRHPASPQMAYCFEAFQESLSSLSPLQATAVPQPIAGGHVTTLDGFGRFAACTMEARSDMESAWTGSRDRLDVRLMVIGYDLVWDCSGALDRLAKECLGTGCVAVLAQQHIDDHAILVNGPIQVPLLPFAEQQDLVHEPAPTDRIPSPTDLSSQSRSERLDPVEDGAMRDVNAAFGQQLQHLPARQRVGQVPPHCGQDDLGRPAITAEG